MLPVLVDALSFLDLTESDRFLVIAIQKLEWCAAQQNTCEAFRREEAGQSGYEILLTWLRLRPKTKDSSLKSETCINNYRACRL